MTIIKGYITSKVPLAGNLCSENQISGDLKSKDSVSGAVHISGNLSAYNGDYVVTPSVKEQFLKTANKKMLDDVTIKEIPFFETSNNSGGNTVYIGKEL